METRNDIRFLDNTIMDSRKEEIADQFQRHFNHYGFKKTSVDEVARELHISKKTIYQYFSTKEEVFYHIVSRIARQYRDSMERELVACPTYTQKLDHLIRLIFAESRKWLKTNDAFEFKYKYDIARLAFQDMYTGLVAELVEKGMQAGEFAPQQVDMAARFIRGIITESMNALVTKPEMGVEDNAIQAILKLLQ